MKAVKQLLYAHEADMGGMPIRQPLPTRAVDQVDPFLLLHHHKTTLQPGGHPRSLGVPPHPHRGFSPVTFVIQGQVHHRDSLGNSTVVGPGGVQWLKSGRGITHSERPSMELAANGGTQEILQLWVNLPAKHKMDAPSYWNLAPEQMPLVGPAGSSLRLASGKMEDKTGPVQDEAAVTAVFGQLEAGSSFAFPVLKGQNALVYAINGNISVSGFGLVEALNLVHFEPGEGSIEVKALEDAHLLFLAAEPLNEPISTYGPIVMNTTTQIMEALRDAQMGKMGFLVEEF